jgi:hypothetical protein
MNKYIQKLKVLLVFAFSFAMSNSMALPVETQYLGVTAATGYVDDGSFGTFPIGFNFDFFGNTYSDFYVTSNGLVTFGTSSSQYTNAAIPTAAVVNNYIAPFWDDIVIHATGSITYQTIGTAPNRKCVVQFNNMSFWNSPILLGTFQVILYEGSNNIQTQYRSIVDLTSDRASGNSATVGLENSDGTAGVTYSYNTANSLASEDAILYTPDGSGSYNVNGNSVYEGIILVDAIPRAGITNLVSPAYNSVVGEDVTFQWDAASDAAYYNVVISQNSDLSTPIHTSANLTVLDYDYTLLANETYYWSVNSYNSSGIVTWSEIWVFQTSSSPPLVSVTQTLYIEQGQQSDVTLLFTGGDAGTKTATITSLPVEGSLYQYNGGVLGAQITTVPTDVTDPSFKVIYLADGLTGNGVGSFDFHFTDATFTSTDVTYIVNVSPPGVPNFQYAAKEVDRVEITFDRDMADPTGTHLEFAVQDNGVAVTSTSCQLKAGDPSTIIVYVSPNLNIANTITVAYTKGTVLAASGGILESFSFQLAGKIAQVINFLPLVDKTYGDPDYTVSATASSGLAVTFSTSNSTVVGVSGTNCTVNNAGSTIIGANQAGDATYAPVTFGQIQNVLKATAVITLADLSQNYTGSGIAGSATTVPPGLIVSIQYDGDAILPTDPGSYVVYAEIIDDNYQGSATGTLVITDNTAPVADVTTLTNATGECSVTPVTPTATDNFDGAITGTTTTIFPITSQGTTVVTWTYTDASSNVSSQTQNVVINDVTAPIADVATLSNVTNECSVGTLTAPTATDNCGGTVTVTNNATLPITAQGTTIVTWTYEDGNGNTTDQAQNIVITDVTTPVADVATLTNVTAECSVTTLTEPTATDNCGTVTVTNDASLPITAQGTTIVTWTYDDGNGNTTDQTQNIVITDVTAPVADVVTLANVTAECTVTALTAPSATDNCNGTVTVTNDASLPITAQGTTIVTWTYDDGNGNTTDQVQNVVITDVTAPVADVVTLTNVTAECSVTTLTEPTATDNCNGIVTVTNDASLPITAQGTTIVTWTYTDENNNSSIQTQNVILADVTDPVLAGCSSTITQNADALGCGSAVTWTSPTATDNCSAVVITSTHNSGDVFFLGTTTVEYTATDASGNTATCSFDVTINSDLTVVLDSTHNALCADSLNGQAFVTVTGGGLGYLFEWDNDGTGDNDDMEDQNGLAAGNYDLVVTDAYGCNANVSASITEPTPLTITVDNVSNPNACALADGAIDITVGGGVAGYTYDWNNDGTGDFDDIEDLSSVLSGVYIVEVMDVNGCTVNASITLSDPSGPVVVVDSTFNNICNADTLGSIYLSYSGGVAPYLIDWDNDGIGDNDDSLNLINLAEGDYNITITDDNGCVGSSSINISEPLAITTTPVLTEVICNGDSTATAVLNPTGGTGVLTEDWGLFNANELNVGFHTFVVTDANGCTLTDSVEIIEPEAVSYTDSTLTVSCNGDTDGEIYITPLGGTPTYLVIWAVDTATSQIALAPGYYSFNIEDANGCILVDSIEILEPAVLEATTTFTSELFGTDGSIDLTVTGGTMPYTFDWDNDGTGDNDDDEDLIDVVAGTYTVTVTDLNGCTTTAIDIIDSQVGIEELTSESILIYPNPSNTGVINIQFEGVISQITLIDMSGRTIGVPTNIEEGVIDVSNLESGKYLIQIILNDKSITKQVVVQ